MGTVARVLLIAAGAGAATAYGAGAASAQVVSGTQISVTEDSATDYAVRVYQTLGDDPTGIFFTYTGATLSENNVTADEESDWYLANDGDTFSAATIAAGEFPVIFTADDPRPPVTIPLGDFYLGMNTGTGASSSPTFRDVYGWLELDNTGTALIPVDNAVAYGDDGIIIGTTTAIVLEPASIALLSLALSLLLKRSKRA